MRFLIDNNLSPRLGTYLREFGYEAEHVADVGMQASSDSEICMRAVADGSILITADNDFPEMLALSGADRPSVIFLTGTYPTEPERLSLLLHNQLDLLKPDLERGCVVAIDGGRIRIRELPIGR